MNASPAFTIRDGVLYVRDWEWSSESSAILGLPIAAKIWVTARLVGFVFENGYEVSISLYPDDPERCYAFFWFPNGTMDWERFHSPYGDRHTSEELLEMIRDIASRPPLVPGPARQEGSPQP